MCFDLPSPYQLESDLLARLSGCPIHQRCVVGQGGVLLVVHEVPMPGVPEREALFFWKREDNQWVQPSVCEGLHELADLIERYAMTIDAHEEELNVADQAASLFAILRHCGPLVRSLRNMANAFEQVMAIDQEDRAMMGMLDRAHELVRAAELLHSDEKMALQFQQAEQA